MVTRKFSTMTRTLLYIFNSLDHHFKLKRKRWTSPLNRCQRKRLFFVDVSTNWETDRNWHTQLFDTWKVTQLNLHHQESVKCLLSHKKYMELNFTYAKPKVSFMTNKWSCVQPSLMHKDLLQSLKDWLALLTYQKQR